MSERMITATIESPTLLPLTSGCYADYRNERFYLIESPTVKKVSSVSSVGNAFQYTATFYTAQKELEFCDFLDIVPDASTMYYTGTPQVSFNGNINDLAGRIKANLDQLYTGAKTWTVTVVGSALTNSETLEISLSDSKVWDALTLANTTELWGYNFTVRNRTITIGTVGQTLTPVFQYGRGNGLYDIQRTNVDATSIITRLRAYGAQTNIQEDYRKECGRTPSEANTAGRVAPVYQYIKELTLPQVAFIDGATVNAVSKGAYIPANSHAVGDLVNYTDGERYYCKATAAAGILPTNTTYWTIWPKDYIEASPEAISEFGIRPSVFRDETIYPTIKGMTVGELVTAGLLTGSTGDATRVDEILATSVIDSETQTFDVWVRNWGFDLNQYTNTDTPTLNIINSPNLNGYGFEISKCVEDIKVFDGRTSKYKLTLVKNNEDNFLLPDINSGIYSRSDAGYKVPEVGGQMAHFTLTSITMPMAYILAAEIRLLASAQAHLAKYSTQKVTYTLSIDDINMARNLSGIGAVMLEGDLMKVQDDDLDIKEGSLPRSIIIQQLTITEGEEIIPKYAVTLSDTPVATRLNAIENNIKDVIVDVEINSAEVGRETRNQVRNMNRLKDVIFDPDDYFDTENIRPNSIETLYLSVGSKSMNFVLVDDIQPNYLGDANRIKFSDGKLYHREAYRGIELNQPEASEKYVWTMTGGDYAASMPNSNLSYYIYARCNRTTDSGNTFLISSSQLEWDAQLSDGFYLFLIGVVYNTIAGVRGDALSYGKTYINGRFITTGVITSADGNCFIDLDLNRLQLESADGANGLYWNEALTPGKLRVVGGIIQSSTVVDAGGNESSITVDRGAFTIDKNPFHPGNTTTYEGTLYYCHTLTVAGIIPTNTDYFRVHVEKGVGGANARYVALTSTASAIVFNTAGTLVSPDSGTLNVTPYNFVGTPYYEFFNNDVSLGAASVTPSKVVSLTGLTYSMMPLKVEVQAREGSATAAIVAQDLISIVGLMPGSNGISVVNKNQSHTVPASSSGAVSSYVGSGTTIQVYEGSNLLEYNTMLGFGKFSIGSPTIIPTGTTAITVGARSGSGTTTATIANHSGMLDSQDTVVITYPLTIRRADGTDITMSTSQTITKSKAGATGNIGPSGPALVNRGLWNDAVTNYQGSPIAIDVVSTGSYPAYIWYKAKTTAGTIPVNTPPTNTTYWETFGGQFESIATGTLLAENANIANFIFKDGKMISQWGKINGVDSNLYDDPLFIPNMVLDGELGDGDFQGNLKAGTIGGFGIDNGWIGSDPNFTGDGLLLTDNYLRVSGINNRVEFGENIKNDLDYDQACGLIKNVDSNPTGSNVGLEIVVSGGINKNYSVLSNSPLMSTSFIQNRAKLIHVGVDSWNFAQDNLFILYSDNDLQMVLPTESDVSEMFMYPTQATPPTTLPSDFATIFTIHHGNQNAFTIQLNGITDQNNNIVNRILGRGDTIILMCTKVGGFHYQEINLYQ